MVGLVTVRLCVDIHCVEAAMIKWIILLLLTVIMWDVRDIKLQLRSTQTQATTAAELVKYWLPPISKTRMKNDCGRCHR